MLKLKTHSPYYEAYADYQTFGSVADMIDTVKRYKAIYTLTAASEAVLNTIKLHAKNYVGVCWLYRAEIARKAGVSLSSVKRAICALKEAGIISVHSQIHTKRGGTTHNVYTINSLPCEPANEPSNEPALPSEIAPTNPRVPTVTDKCERVHKNLNKDLNNKDLKRLKIDKDLYVEVLTTNSTNFDQTTDPLKSIPAEFIAIMAPFYANNPQIIADRYKSACIAIKKTSGSIANTSWADVADAWKATVQRYKRNKINNATDDGLGGYFYATLLGQLPLIW